VAAVRDNLLEWGGFPDETIEATQAIFPCKSRLDPVCRVQLRDKNSQLLQHILSKRDATTGDACVELVLPKLRSRKNLVESDRLILEAYEYCHGRIQELGATKALDLFVNLTEKVYLLVCIPANIRIARNLVMGLGKGKNLEPVDEFKGMVCFNSIKEDETLQDETLDKWNVLCEEVGRKNLESACLLFAQIWLRRSVHRNGEMDLMEDFLKQYIEQHDVDGAIFFGEKICPASKTLTRFRNGHVTLVSNGGPSYKSDDLPSLVFLQSACQIPASKEIELVVLHFLMQWELTRDDVEKIGLQCSLRKLEKIAVWMMLAKPTPSARLKRCFEIIDSGNNVLPAGSSNPLDLTHEENIMVFEKLTETPFGGNAPGTKIAKAILERLNEFLLVQSSQGRVNPMDKSLQLEHVLPQKYDKVMEWTRLWDTDSTSIWMHRLGNLALLNQKVNAKISNGSFESKRSHLEASPYPLTRLMAKYTTWDVEAVQTHHETVASLAIQVWNLKSTQC
jgi:hypothetical protein